MSTLVWRILLLVVATRALPEPSSSSSGAQSRHRRQADTSNLSDVELICRLSASASGITNEDCAKKTPPSSGPTSAPGSCTCAPVWQCKDNNVPTGVENDPDSFLTSVNVRTGGFRCGKPEEVCCHNIDATLQPQILPFSPTCGKRNTKGVGTTFVGFENRQSQFGEFPWMAAVMTSERFGELQAPLYICGGALVHAQVVLTAAHYVQGILCYVDKGLQCGREEAKVVFARPGIQTCVLLDLTGLLVELSMPAPTLAPHHLVVWVSRCLAHNQGMHEVLDEMGKRLLNWQYDLENGTSRNSRSQFLIRSTGSRRCWCTPNYVGSILSYDVALLILDSPAQLGHTIDTICLPPPHLDFHHHRCVVSGWGKDMFSEVGKFQQILKSIDLPPVDHGSCELAMRGTRLGPGFHLHDSFMCAGGEQGKDACEGDGGSPLVCHSPDDPSSRYYQIGVVSWGIGCGEAGLPGVYADVTKAVLWIDSIIADRFGHDLRTSSGK
ncbi:Phenoloxidase-activating factor 2 [Chionoecetes opilio]|uniref:Phenoloxidase-activating factor 2 n=1 Tax=Chionoecetes opilio TaxID=41210 RepID=A0A8J4XWP4_CHIOP|nr:Phenoloxidase-activating factor 2 [Chionoecetes opilio]